MPGASSPPDGESWCDFYLNSGHIVRGYIELDWLSSAHPTMDGVSLYELFGEDQVVFAG